MEPELPRILSPNLGCPFLISAQELETSGIDIVMAEESGFVEHRLSLVAQPSYPGEGKEFALELKGRAELTEDTLPRGFQRPEQTRFLISTTLRSSIFSGKARFFRYQATLPSPIDEEMFRRINHQPRPTLYDLILKHDGQYIRTVFHALCLRLGNDRLRFIHLTDLHIALRNDLYEMGLRDYTSYSRPERAARNHFNNFNENLRRFILYANGLADQGELEFVLILGDLIDFLQHGLNDREDFGDNNFRVFRNLILGTGNERNRRVPNSGLKVPIFTSTGNHDWRFYPPSPGDRPDHVSPGADYSFQLGRPDQVVHPKKSHALAGHRRGLAGAAGLFPDD